jgi:hypothetical protein
VKLRLPLHARSHLRQGSDPIPGLLVDPAVSGGPVGTYFDYLLSLSNLIGYWRLGEAASPWADTSGATGGPRNMTLHGSGLALTADVTGALPPAQDDGAVQFNYDGSSGTGGRYLEADPGTPSTFWNLNHMSVAAFFKTSAAVGPRAGTIVSSRAYVISGSNYAGWSLYVGYPSRLLVFARWPGGAQVDARTPAGVDADTWYHVVGTYNGSAIKLYVDGALVDTTADTSNTAVGINHEPAQIGYDIGNFEHLWLTGSVDEVAIWDVALTDEQIANLYTLGRDTVGAAAGLVLTSDGSGGTSWEEPTIRVTY